MKEQLRQNVEGASLSKFRYAKRDGRLLVLAVVRAPQSVGPAQVSQMQAGLRNQVDPTLDLVVRSLVGVDTSDAGYLPDFDDSRLLPQTDDVQVQQ